MPTVAITAWRDDYLVRSFRASSLSYGSDGSRHHFGWIALRSDHAVSLYVAVGALFPAPEQIGIGYLVSYGFSKLPFDWKLRFLGIETTWNDLLSGKTWPNLTAK